MDEPRRTVNVHEAKTHFSRLIDAAHAGETIVLAKGGKPLPEDELACLGHQGAFGQAAPPRSL